MSLMKLTKVIWFRSTKYIQTFCCAQLNYSDLWWRAWLWMLSTCVSVWWMDVLRCQISRHLNRPKTSIQTLLPNRLSSYVQSNSPSLLICSDLDAAVYWQACFVLTFTWRPYNPVVGSSFRGNTKAGNYRGNATESTRTVQDVTYTECIDVHRHLYLHCAPPKKNVTTFSTITLTISVRLQ